MLEDIRREVCGVCDCGSGLSDARRVNDGVYESGSGLCDSNSSYEHSCGPCSCLIVVE